MHFRSSRGFMHMRIQESQTAEGPSYILGQFSKPFRYTKCNVQTGAYKQSVSLIIFCCLGKVAYSATIGWFLKKICFKFSYKRSPTIWHFWDIWKYITFKEKTLGLFSPTFGKFGILLIPPSGHTGSLLYWRPCLLWSERWNMKSINAAFLSFLKSNVIYRHCSIQKEYTFLLIPEPFRWWFSTTPRTGCPSRVPSTPTWSIRLLRNSFE